jgi:phosphopantothenoylcysteine decarboxylase/phosphopantothenate--cysteine ligase
MDTSMTIPLFEDTRIILGVSGSVAAYKAADLASRLAQAGADVNAILTESALRFVAPLTFQSVTGRRAFVDADLWGSEAHVLHVGLARGASLIVIAPATANTIAKLAHGQADNLLTTLALAAECPLMVAPAMDAGMFSHPATQDNLETLSSRGVSIIGPASGHLASWLKGPGRMVEPEEIFGRVRLFLGRNGGMAGRSVVVTAGGTHEAIDPVRVIANRSSGKQGFALAQAALDRGAKVTLISGPVSLPTPAGADRVDVTTAAQMAEAVMKAVGGADALVMAAAVADFRPTQTAERKIRRGGGPPSVVLEATEDILGKVMAGRESSGRPIVVVGFAAESHDLVESARVKLHAKGLDLIVANDILSQDSGFGSDNNRVTLLDADDTVQELAMMSKAEVAEVVVDRVERMLV